MKIKLYDSNSIDHLPWPDNENGREVRKFFVPLMKEGIKNYILNLETDLRIIHIDDLVLPVTINNKEYDNSFACSPYAHYVLQAQEIFNDKHPFLKWSFKPTLKTFSQFFKWGSFNKLIVVNNWLFATNLHPKIEKNQLKEILAFLTAQFPEHVICFRSLSKKENSDLTQNLSELRFRYLANRPIYYFDPTEEEVFSKRIFKSDIKLLRESGYEILENHEIPLSEDKRLTELYNAVYLGKHSKYHPQFNSEFLQLALSEGTFQIRALRKNGRIDAVTAFHLRNGMMVAPFLGYDTTLCEKTLYRLISTVLYLESKKQQVLFNLSAGASFYKKIRRGQMQIEYLAIYDHHLGLSRRISWNILRTIINSLGLSFMKMYAKTT